MGIFTGSDQEHLGNVFSERPAGRGLILWVSIENCDGNQVYGGLHGDGGGAGLMVVVEGVRVEVSGVHHGRGVMQAPVDRLCGNSEVPPAGVGFCAARHPGHMEGVPSYG